MLSQGRYVGTILDHGIGALTTAKKTPYCKIEFRLTGVEENGEYVELDATDQVIRNITAWLSDKAIERSIENLKKYAGWDGRDLDDLNRGVLVNGDIEVVYRGKNDGGYDDFDWPYEGGGGTVEKDDQVARQLRNKFAKLFGSSKPAVKRGRKKTEKPSEAPDTQPADDDEIPF